MLHLTVPYQLELLYHTLQVEAPKDAATSPPVIAPARASLKQPAQLSIALRLAPLSTVRVVIAGKKSFLHADDFDHEPFRGVIVPPARLVVSCSDLAPAAAGARAHHVDAACALMESAHLISSALRLRLAVPDMSMPFNVMMLVGTLWSIVFGAVISLAYGGLRKEPAAADKAR